MNLFDAMEQATKKRLAARKADGAHGLYAVYHYRQPDSTYQVVAECDCTRFFTAYGPRLVADTEAVEMLQGHVEAARQMTPILEEAMV